MLMPFSPIMVFRPYAKFGMSSSSWAALMAYSNRCSLYLRPKMMFSSIVAEKMKGSYSTYATEPRTVWVPDNLTVSSKSE